MIKSIIQKIILSNFGKFIKGIERDKLSVDLFGGNFRLENIQLNHEFFDSLNTPFRLAFSSIGKLNLQAPLSKLSSVPVECILDNIYVIVQFKTTARPQQREEMLRVKKQAICTQVAEVFDTYIRKLKEQKQQDGMMARLGRKIIDNLQLKIVNVHIRFEEHSASCTYGWGLTLKEISFTTTDRDWQATFVDRNEHARPEKLFKMMKVEQLNIYWQSGEGNSNILISMLAGDQAKKEQLAAMVRQPKNTILGLTSQFQLAINPLEDVDSPIYELQVKLKPINFELERLQVQQMIDFAQKNIMQNELILRTISCKRRSKLSEEETARLRKRYEREVEDILSAQEAGIPYCIRAEDMDEVLERVQLDELMLWMIVPIKAKVRAVRQNQLKKKKRGWFGGATELTEDQQLQLKRYVDEAFEQERFTRPEKSLFFRLNMKLESGRFVFIDRKRSVEEEQNVELNLGRIDCSISKSENYSLFELRLSLESVSLNLYLPTYPPKATKTAMEIFSNQRGQTGRFIQLVVRQQMEEKSKVAKPVLRKSMHGEIQTIVVYYKKLFMKKFKQFFTFKSMDSLMRNTNFEKFEPVLQERQEEPVPQLQIEFDVGLNIISPMLICPLNEQECWCLSLGHLHIDSKRSVGCEEYPMSVTSAFLRYYPDMHCLVKSSQSQKTISIHPQGISVPVQGRYVSQQGIFSVINDINFSLLYRRSKGLDLSVSENCMPSSSLQIQLPSFTVNFTQKRYDNLLSLANIFKLEEGDSNSVDILRKLREEVEEGKSFQGPLSKKNQLLSTWKDYHGLLSGEYLYLYLNKHDLKQAEKVLVRGCKVLRRHLQEQNQEAVELQLISPHVQCTLSCEQVSAVLRWKYELQSKIKQFKTIYELMNCYERDEPEEVSDRKRKDVIAGEAKRVICLGISKIQFRYSDDQEDCLMQCEIHDVRVVYEQLQGRACTAFTMRQLRIVDRIYKYKNAKYQPLLQAKCTRIEVVKLSKSERKRVARKHNIDVQWSMQELRVNWKPDVLLILMRLMDKHFSSERKFRLEDGQAISRQQQFQQVRSDNKFKFLVEQYAEKGKGVHVKSHRKEYLSKNKFINEVLKVKLVVDEIDVVMIHRESHIPMFQLIAQSICNEFVMGENQRFVAGAIAVLELYDLSGYPQRVYERTKDYEPHCLLRKKMADISTNKLLSQQQAAPLLQYNWSSFDPATFPNEERVDSFLSVRMQPIAFEYYQQVTFRLIDYALIQVILLLLQPQMVTANENLLEQLKRNSDIIDKPITILFSQYEEVIRRLINPYFMDMYFHVKEPTLLLKAEKDGHIYHRCDMGELTFENRQVKCSNRFAQAECPDIKQYVYEQQYLVRVRECNMITVIESHNQNGQHTKKDKLFGPVDFNLVLNKLIMQDQLKLVYPEVETYDRGFKSKSIMPAIFIEHCSRLQYLHLNKLVNFNFTFDDENDELFIHNFKITKLLSPKPIYYGIQVPSLLINADFNIEENALLSWKLFKAEVESFRFEYNREKNMSSSFEIVFYKTTIVGYQYDSTLNFGANNQDQGYKFGDIRQFKYAVNKEPSKQKVAEKQQQGSNSKIPIIVEPTAYPLIYFKENTKIHIDNRLSGERVIQMDIESLQVSVRTGLLQLLLQYSLAEDWVFPVINKYVPELSFFANIHEMSAELQEDPKVVLARINSGNVRSRREGSHDLRLFRLQGVFCYKYNRKKGFSGQELKEMMQRGELSFKEVQALPESAYMTVILNTEIYRCLSNSNAKRKVVEKFTYNMTEKRYWKVADQANSVLKNISKRAMNLDRCFLKISFADLIFMRQILAQISEQRQYIAFLKSMTGQQMTQRSQQSLETELSSLDNIEIQIESLSFYLINSNEKLIPILKVSINEITLSISNTFKKDIFSGYMSLALYYFNSIIFRWEPMLEKTALAFHRLTYHNEQSQVYGSFEATQPILCNISREIFLALRETMEEWNKQSQAEQQRYLSPARELEQLEFIPYYVIRNETGYDLEIYNDKRALIQTIKHNEQMNYVLRMEDYDEDMECNTEVGTRVLHPSYRLQIISGVSFNLHKSVSVIPKLQDRERATRNMKTTGKVFPSQRDKLVIQSSIINHRKTLLIKSSKYIFNYLDNVCECTALPFDHPDTVRLPKHGNIEVSLYQTTKANHNFRYIGEDGILKILKLNLVYNYCPIPLNICGKFVQPNEYIGISEPLTIQHVKTDRSMLKVVRNDKQKEYYIYAQSYVIDYYGLTFDFGERTNQMTKMYSFSITRNGHKAEIYLLPESDSKFKVRYNDSKAVSVKPTLGKSPFTLETSRSRCHFISYAYLSSFNEKLGEFIRVIQITPQYMLSNACNHMLKICQIGSCSSLNLQPCERVPFFWQNKNLPEQIKISYYDGQDLWGYSGAVLIARSTESLVLRKASDPTMYRILSIQVEPTNTVTFVHITQPSARYLLANTIPGTRMVLWQTEIKSSSLDSEFACPNEFVFNVDYGETKPFGYEMPQESHRLTVIVELDQKREEHVGLYCEPVDLEDMQQSLLTKHVYVQRASERVRKYYLILCFQNNVKKLKLQAHRDQIDEESKYEYVIKLPSIGISLIGNHDGIRKEIVHLLLSGLEVDVFGNEDLQEYKLLIRDCRLENEFKTNAIFPILLSTVTCKFNYFLSVFVSRSPRNPRLVNQIGISINQTVLTITSEEVQLIQECIKSFMYVNKTEGLAMRNCEAIGQNSPVLQQSLYFIMAQIHPLKTNLTFRQANNWGGRLVKAFDGIQNCTFLADGIKMTHFGATNLSSFLGILKNHYQSALMKMILPVLANLNILGNPISLAQSIGSGFKDLVQLPAAGFKHSPLEGGKGIAKGVGSLVKQTFCGAFNTVESITGSIGNGITFLVDDDAFDKDRLQIKNDRSEHIGKGLINGAKSIGNGFKNGLFGLINQPMEGAQKNGLLGFLTGGLKGITGLVIKPVSGVIDAVTKTSQGIKNTPGYFSEQAEKELERKHQPRPFYNYCRQFRMYDPQLAELIVTLEKEKEDEKYHNLSWSSYYLLVTEKKKLNSRFILLLSFEYAFIYDLEKVKLYKSFQCSSFHSATLDNRNPSMVHLNIYGKRKEQMSLKDQSERDLGTLVLHPESGGRRLVNELNAIICHNNPQFKFID